MEKDGAGQAQRALGADAVVGWGIQRQCPVQESLTPGFKLGSDARWRKGLPSCNLYFRGTWS